MPHVAATIAQMLARPARLLLSMLIPCAPSEPTLNFAAFGFANSASSPLRRIAEVGERAVLASAQSYNPAWPAHYEIASSEELSVLQPLSLCASQAMRKISA